MKLRIRINTTIDLDELWGTPDDFDDALDAAKQAFEEDFITAMYEARGVAEHGITKLIESAEWVDE